MSDLTLLALINAAAKALPNGTTAERAAWCKAHEREFIGAPKSPKPFHEVADIPAVARTSGDQ